MVKVQLAWKEILLADTGLPLEKRYEGKHLGQSLAKLSVNDPVANVFGGGIKNNIAHPVSRSIEE